MGIAATLLPPRPISGPSNLSTFVTVGNATQPFDRLLRTVAELSAKFPQPVIVQRGPSTISHRGWEVREFLRMDEFESLIEHSALLIMHAGAGSVIHAVRAGRLPIVMPRRAKYGEHVDDHQVEFATALSSTGHVLLAQDSSELSGSIQTALVEPGRPAAVPTKLVEHIHTVLMSFAVKRPEREIR